MYAVAMPRPCAALTLTLTLPRLSSHCFTFAFKTWSIIYRHKVPGEHIHSAERPSTWYIYIYSLCFVRIALCHSLTPSLSHTLAPSFCSLTSFGAVADFCFGLILKTLTIEGKINNSRVNLNIVKPIKGNSWNIFSKWYNNKGLQLQLHNKIIH